MAQVLAKDDSSTADNGHLLNGNGRAVEADRLQLSKLAPHLLLLLLLLLAFALRVYALERQSMWSDEGLSLYRARQAPVDILNGLIVIDGVETRDTNPPLYFLLLHLLRNVGGETIFALRYSGVLAGILAVPLTYVLGTAAYGRRVGLFAALLMAISPFHIWQSQVLRNYSMLLTLNLASVYGLFRFALAKPGRAQKRWLVLWLAAGLLGIYTHYFGFFVFAFGLLVLLILMLWRQGISSLARQRRTWLILGGALIILLPAVIIAFDRFRSGQQVDFHYVPLSQVLIHAASAFAVGVVQTLTHPWWLVLPALMLALAGLLIGWRTRRLPTIILIGYQLIPLGLLLLLSTINPLYNGVRHLLIGLPPFLLFVATGAVGTPLADAQMSRHRKAWPALRWLRLVLALLVILIQVGWLYLQFTDHDLLRDDIRGAAEYLNEFAEPTDLIILHDTIIGLTFDYYYDGAAPWKAIPSLDEQNTVAAEAVLAAAGPQADRIWFLVQPTPRTGFPRKVLWEWAETNWPRFFSREFPRMWLRVQLNGYIPEPAIVDLPKEVTLLEAEFDSTLRLHGVELPLKVKAGETWWTTFYWSQLQQEAGEYILSLRLVDEQGRLWQQQDGLLWHEYLDHQWPVETMLRKDYEKTLASGLPPGKYGVWLRVLDVEQQPVPARDGQVDHFLGDIEIEAGTEISQLPLHTTQQSWLGEVEFMGYNLPPDDIRPGHGIPFELFWRVRQTPAQDYNVRIRLIDPSGDVAAESTNMPTRADYPMSHWQAGELLQSKFQMLMPANIEIVPHSVEVALVSPANGEVVAAVTLKDQLTADPWPYVAELPPELTVLNVEIGDLPSIALRGYDLPVADILPGESLDFTLYWQAITDVPQGYYVFIHLMSEDDTIVSQYDGAPVQGFRPTMSWREGEVIEDTYAIPIDPEVPPGTYRLWAGLYHPGTGERPAIAIDDQVATDKRIFIQEINVKQVE